MRPRSLKSRLLLAVAALVIGSGLVIAFLVTQQYSAALRRAMFSQAENLAHSVALDAADKILLNDLVALQKNARPADPKQSGAGLYLCHAGWPGAGPHL